MSNPFWSADQVKRIFMEHEGYVERVWAHCKPCSANSRELKREHGPWDQTPHISDDELHATFEPDGWVFLNDGTALCPACAAATLDPEEHRP